MYVCMYVCIDVADTPHIAVAIMRRLSSDKTFGRVKGVSNKHT